MFQIKKVMEQKPTKKSKINANGHFKQHNAAELAGWQQLQTQLKLKIRAKRKPACSIFHQDQMGTKVHDEKNDETPGTG